MATGRRAFIKALGTVAGLSILPASIRSAASDSANQMVLGAAGLEVAEEFRPRIMTPFGESRGCSALLVSAQNLSPGPNLTALFLQWEILEDMVATGVSLLHRFPRGAPAGTIKTTRLPAERRLLRGDQLCIQWRGVRTEEVG